MEKKLDLPAEYLKLGRYLWERINLSDPKDADTQDMLSQVANNLLGLFDDEGFMMELDIWAADRRDTGESWQRSGDSLKKHYPKFFEQG